MPVDGEASVRSEVAVADVHNHPIVLVHFQVWAALLAIDLRVRREVHAIAFVVGVLPCGCSREHLLIDDDAAWHQQQHTVSKL